MTRQLLLASAVAMAVATPAVSETAPADVVFDGGAIAASLSGAAGNAEEGATIMTSRPQGNCVACHKISAMPKVAFQGNIAPPLDGVASRYDEAQLRGLVANAKMTFEGSMMPAFYKNTGYIRPGDAYTGDAAKADLPPILTAQQVEDVVAYLLTLKE